MAFPNTLLYKYIEILHEVWKFSKYTAKQNKTKQTNQNPQKA